MLTLTGCSFSGLNSLPLPGATGRGSGANVYHVEIANVGQLEANSPVMIDDVIVGSISKMTVQNWHANLDISLNPGTSVPANVVARVGQTSLLGSMHLELEPPLGEPGKGRLQPGATIPLSRTSTYPSTEQTLSSLSVILNAGGLGQFGDIIHNFNGALSGHAGELRELLSHLDRFIGTLDQQRDNLVASIQALNRLSGTFAAQRDVITQALHKIPPALEVLTKERPRITEALHKLGTFSDTATRLVNDAGDDLVKNLQNVAPAIGALADIGPDLDAALAYAPTFPFTQGFIDRFIRGDYVNGYFVIDLTNAGLRKSILLGTHWGRLGAEIPPKPGDPPYLQFRYGAPPGAPGALTGPGPVGEPLRGPDPRPWQPGMPPPNEAPVGAPPVPLTALLNGQSADAPPLPGPPPAAQNLPGPLPAQYLPGPPQAAPLPGPPPDQGAAGPTATDVGGH
ncbi:mammalian cell entry protein [Mycobacterium shigaense]|nr:mammalian cell entry protein [Mycobacterium shigaense]